MKAHIEIIGSGSYDCSSSVQLFFDNGRYLFDCGDGTQRLCTEYGIKLSKLRGVYLSSVTAPSVGGLFGLLLTAADSGKDKLSIFGPKGMKALFQAARYFFYRPNLINTVTEVNMNKGPSDTPVTITDDSSVSIQAVPINARRDMEIDTAFGMHCDAVSYICRLKDLPGKFDPQKAAKLGVKKGRMYGMLQKGLTMTLDDGTQVRSDQVMSPAMPGPVVLIIACPSEHHINSLTASSALRPSNLGLVPAKPSMSATAPGTSEDTTRKDNVKDELKAEDKDKDKAEKGSQKSNGAANTTNKQMQRKCVICHLAPREVLTHEHYRQWCDTFGDDVSHITMHSTMARRQAVYLSQAEDMVLLHYSVDKDIFPLPQDCLFPSAPSSTTEARGAVDAKKALVISLDTTAAARTAIGGGDSGNGSDDGDDETWGVFKNWRGSWFGSQPRLRFGLAPASNTGIDRSNVVARYVERKPGDPLKPWREQTPPDSSEPAPAGKEVAMPVYMKSLPPRTAAVRFLGTGAALPGKRRNVSASLLDLYARGSVLLDCGEGTWGQLVRMYGREVAQRVLCGIKVIFISHMHADHHLGLMAVLHQRSLAMLENPELAHGPQLVLVGPIPLESWLDGFQRAAHVPMVDTLAAPKRAYRFFNAAQLTDPQTVDAKFFADAFGLDLGCVAVIHCPLAYGLVIRDCVHGWKVVYSGDTRPCPALVEAGRDATLAIHEATLEDDLIEEALEKNHSTTSEALTVCAQQMQAWRTVLTHFSQRYPKIPRLDDDIVKKLYQNRAAVACDMMSVDFTRLEEIPRIVPALRDCYPDECETWATGLSATDDIKLS